MERLKRWFGASSAGSRRELALEEMRRWGDANGFEWLPPNDRRFAEVTEVLARVGEPGDLSGAAPAAVDRPLAVRSHMVVLPDPYLRADLPAPVYLLEAAMSCRAASPPVQLRFVATPQPFAGDPCRIVAWVDAPWLPSFVVDHLPQLEPIRTEGVLPSQPGPEELRRYAATLPPPARLRASGGRVMALVTGLPAAPLLTGMLAAITAVERASRPPGRPL